MSAMTEVIALPANGEVLLDARGGSRALRVSWHHEVGMVVLSLWQSDRCVGTVRLEAAAVPALVQVLVGGLAAHRQADRAEEAG
jgi:hypothetical protein